MLLDLVDSPNPVVGVFRPPDRQSDGRDVSEDGDGQGGALEKENGGLKVIKNVYNLPSIETLSRISRRSGGGGGGSSSSSSSGSSSSSSGDGGGSGGGSSGPGNTGLGGIYVDGSVNHAKSQLRFIDFQSAGRDHAAMELVYWCQWWRHELLTEKRGRARGGAESRAGGIGRRVEEMLRVYHTALVRKYSTGSSTGGSRGGRCLLRQ